MFMPRLKDSGLSDKMEIKTLELILVGGGGWYLAVMLERRWRIFRVNPGQVPVNISVGNLNKNRSKTQITSIVRPL